IANRHPGYHELSKRFLCPEWQQINLQKIQYNSQTGLYTVPSASTNKFYIVDTSIGTCTCPVALGRAPCKHQAAVAVKYHAWSFDYIPALSLDDCVKYNYIACGTIVEDPTFFASLRASNNEW
ncbi:2460_t:CDS:2, partial [Dentiscutata heterogama]